MIGRVLKKISLNLQINNNSPRNRTDFVFYSRSALTYNHPQINEYFKSLITFILSPSIFLPTHVICKHM